MGKTLANSPKVTGIMCYPTSFGGKLAPSRTDFTLIPSREQQRAIGFTADIRRDYQKPGAKLPRVSIRSWATSPDTND